MKRIWERWWPTICIVAALAVFDTVVILSGHR